MKVTVALVIYENYDRVDSRLINVVLPTLRHYQNKYKLDLVLFDNSPFLNYAFKHVFPVSFQYIWNQGENAFYGGAINAIAQAARGEFLVYICANHGRMKQVTWLEDILEPLHDPKCAMSGCLQTSHLKFIGEEGKSKHIQGGIFAARVEMLKKFPYSPEYPHLYSDIWWCRQVEKAGYELVQVPTISSVWRSNSPHEDFKYMHDEKGR